jgi:hypothetical protein
MWLDDHQLTDFDPEDGGSTFLRNVDIHLQKYSVTTQKTKIYNLYGIIPRTAL